MMPPVPPGNRSAIQQEAENIRKLGQFVDQFGETVDNLQKFLQGSAPRQQSVAPMGTGSTMGAQNLYVPNQTGTGWTEKALEEGSIAGPDGVETYKFSLPGQSNRWIQKPALGGPNLNQYERGQIRLGALPGEGVSRGLYLGSYLAGLRGWKTLDDQETQSWLDNGTPPTDAYLDPNTGMQAAPELGEDGMYHVVTNKKAAQVSQIFGFAGQLAQRAPQISKLVTDTVRGALGAGSQYAMLGAQQGLSRTNFMGLPVGSPAYWHGLSMAGHQNLQTWFGLNPMYSSEQAAQAMAVINASGWSGSDTGIWLSNLMRGAAEKSLMQPDQVMQLMDPLLRFTGNNQMNPELVSLTQTIRQLGDVAKASNLSLEQLGQTLPQAVASAMQTTGAVNPGPALASMAAATGIDPSQLATLYQPSNMIVGSEMMGQSYGRVMTNPGMQGRAAMELPTRIFQSMIGGMSPHQYSKLTKVQKQQFINHNLTYAWGAYGLDPNIFGGLSPLQMLHNWASGVNPGYRADAFTQVTTSAPDTLRQALHLIGMFDKGSKHGAAGFEKHFLEQFGPGAKYGDWSNKADREKARQYLKQHMVKAMQQTQQQSGNRVEVVLDPWARKLFHLQGGVSMRNAGDSSWHKAMDIGAQWGSDVGGPVGGVVGGAAGAAGGAIYGLLS